MSTKAVARGGISFTRRGDKIEATYNVPKAQLPEGVNRKRITAHGATETSAQRQLLIKLAANGIVYRPPRDPNNTDGITLGEWLDEWMEDYVANRIQESTKRLYNSQIRLNIKPYIGHIALKKLTPRVILHQWWNVIQNLKKVDADGNPTDEPVLKAHALNNTFKTLKMALNAARAKYEGVTAELNTTLFTPPSTHRPERPAEVEEAAAKVIRLFYREMDRTDPRWSQFMPALLGLRQSERLGLTMDSLDIDRRRPKLVVKQQLAFLKGRGHYLKNATKNGEPRKIPVNKVFVEALRARVALRKEWSERDDWNPEPEFANLLFLQPGGKLLTKNPDNKAWHSLGLNVRGHLNRHITGYLFGRLGVSMEIAGLMLGHKSESFIRYYRVAADEVTGRELDRNYDPEAFLDELDEDFDIEQRLL